MKLEQDDDSAINDPALASGRGGLRGAKMDIDQSSAFISVDTEGSKPDADVSPSGKRAVLHLSRNSHALLYGTDPDEDDDQKARDMSAINLRGYVDVRLGPGEDLSKWEFHFIQYIALMEDGFSYAGRGPGGGMIAGNLANPPAMPASSAFNYMQDGHPGVMPFMNLRQPMVMSKLDKQGHQVRGVSNVTTDMDDHPFLMVNTVRQNESTAQKNYLYTLDRELLFVTNFVARDTRTKAITPLAYVTWRAAWHVEFHWQDGVCTPYPVKGALEVSDSTKGPPSGPGVFRTDLAKRLLNPSEDAAQLGNSIYGNVTKKLNDHPDITNMFYLDKWSARVPANFWR
jgi:hypothetical protein